MAADADRLVDVRGLHPADAHGQVYAENGSGLLVSDELVLTAAHVVFDGDAPLPVALRFDGSDQPVAGEVVWPLPRREVDAALVRIAGPSPMPPGSPPIRWARFTGREARQAVDATGYPAVMRQGDTRISFQLSGHVNPQSALTEGRYVVKVDERPTNEGSPWAGMSGAALMSRGTLVGVVVIDTPGFDRDELTAVPASAIVADPQARALLRQPIALGSAELDPVLARPPVSHGPLSWAQLLRADESVIDFLGRDRQLDQLVTWTRSGGMFDALLLVGPGGRGKTRLAHQLIRQLQHDPEGAGIGGDWLGGLLATNAPAHRLTDLTTTARKHAVLLVADYAESRNEQLQDLLSAYQSADDPPRTRLLLLARDRGDWWTRLCDGYPDLLSEDAVVVLNPLHEPPDRVAAFHSCVDQFARRLHRDEPQTGWQEAAAAVTAPDLTDPCFGDPLSLQLAALLELIEAGEATPGTTGPVERRLLGHERQYWRKTIEARDLKLPEAVRDQAVTAATLIGVQGRPAALTLLQRIPELTEPGRVADWLRSLYPTETSSRYWGPLQPDRLGEHLVGAVSKQDPDLLGHLLGSEDVDELQDALVVIGRAMAHQAHLAEQVTLLAASGRPALVEAIDRAARRVADPLPLQRALPDSRRDGHFSYDPDTWAGGATAGRETASSAPERLYDIGRGIGENPFSSSNPFHDTGPGPADEELTDRGGGTPADSAPPPPPTATPTFSEVERAGRDAERRATEAYEAGNLVRAEQEFRRAAERFFGPGIDEQHVLRVNLARAAVLNDLRSFDAALTLIDEVVGKLRNATRQGWIQPDVLGRALDLQAAVMAETGRAEAAISYEYEAVEILQAFARRTGSPDARRDAAKVNSNLAALLQGVGRLDEAARSADEAVAALSELAANAELALSDDTFGRSLMNRANIAGALGQPDTALELVGRASQEFERIAGLGPAEAVAMVPARAAAAELLCTAALKVGQAADAVPAGEQAVRLFADVAERVPAFVVDLARSQVQLAEAYLAIGEGVPALDLAQRSVRLLREEARQGHDQPSARRRRLLLEEKAHDTQRRAEELVWRG
ncbi:trypsin-like serine protease [Nocardioides sp. MAH-18]|uniref:Trypsin-like serine protease n=1 Tax=Nocardioides agri TaxID=2682843 RepID=A0A6L6XK75_9ACTN|nr:MULTISPECIES: serine protease [unclassified Nocardioides]MBA2956451.1 trypsin-like peptidase domain-containing protein [Nocardioides sp. CGMCC 1.13656]MVQ47599.1 trypsin-like serine protease [Nocardioides sp. MAH-18]